VTPPSPSVYSEDIPPQEKVCTGCSANLPLNDFHKYHKGILGRTSQCKNCVATRNQERKLKNIEIARSAPPLESKICSRMDCSHGGMSQAITQFSKWSLSKDGYNPECKTCSRAVSKQQHTKSREKNNARRRNNYQKKREYSLAQNKEYNAKFPEFKRERGKKYYKINEIKIKAAQKVRRMENPEKEKRRGRNYRRDNWPSYITSAIKCRCREKGIPFDMSPSDLLPLPEYCPIFPHIKLDYTSGPDRRLWASVDRIVPELGYVAGNVWVISFGANSWKCNGSNPEERKRIVAIMNGKKKKKEPSQDQPSLFD
jgi:hypothetical protein